MTVAEYIKKLGENSPTRRHELIAECLNNYDVMGVRELEAWQLKEFCKTKNII